MYVLPMPSVPYDREKKELKPGAPYVLLGCVWQNKTGGQTGSTGPLFPCGKHTTTKSWQVGDQKTKI